MLSQDWTPFSEFKWANFLRGLVPVEKGPDHPDVLETSLHHARSNHASHLPGYMGVSRLSNDL